MGSNARGHSFDEERGDSTLPLALSMDPKGPDKVVLRHNEIRRGGQPGLLPVSVTMFVVFRSKVSVTLICLQKNDDVVNNLL